MMEVFHLIGIGSGMMDCRVIGKKTYNVLMYRRIPNNGLPFTQVGNSQIARVYLIFEHMEQLMLFHH